MIIKQVHIYKFSIQLFKETLQLIFHKKINYFVKMYRQKDVNYSRAEVFGHVDAWIRTLGCFEDYPELNVSDFYIDIYITWF